MFLSAAAATVLSATALAQKAAPPVQPVGPRADAFVGGGGGEIDAPRFDLKFPGGSVKEFVAAVSKALGKPLNVIIPKEGEATVIPAVEVSRVMVASLFRALSTASQHEVFIPGHGVSKVGFHFKIEEANPSPDAVWTFEFIGAVQEPTKLPRAVEYFPIAEFLSHFTVEDITTAIESGWSLQGDTATPPATIRFHEESKLLIVAGTDAQMKLIRQVLEGLTPMLRFPRTDNLPITRKARQIILPSLKFQEALVTEAVDFIRKKAVELDPEHKGFNIVVDASEGVAERTVTLTLSDTPALEALRLIVELCGMQLEIRDHAMLLRERALPARPAFAPAPASSFALPGFPASGAQPALADPTAQPPK